MKFQIVLGEWRTLLKVLVTETLVVLVVYFQFTALSPPPDIIHLKLANVNIDSFCTATPLLYTHTHTNTNNLILSQAI